MRKCSSDGSRISRTGTLWFLGLFRNSSEERKVLISRS